MGGNGHRESCVDGLRHADLANVRLSQSCDDLVCYLIVIE